MPLASLLMSIAIALGADKANGHQMTPADKKHADAPLARFKLTASGKPATSDNPRVGIHSRAWPQTT